MRIALAALAALVPGAACAPGGGSPAAPRAGGDGDAPLGMNDVSILLPLPRATGAPVLAALDDAMIDRRWYDALVAARADIAPRTGGPIDFADFQVVAVRLDLCDRVVVGPCPSGADGRLRLILQPVYVRGDEVFAHDVALHAFYAIPAGELAGTIAELRTMARRDTSPAAPLSVSPAAAAGDARYLDPLRALVRRHARAANLMRLTVIGQIADSAAFAWIFRGIDRVADSAIADGAAEFTPIAIPGVAAAQQTVQLAGGDTVYRSEPIADAPPGFALAANGPRFAAAPADQRAAALAALVEIQDPSRHDTIDTQCIACHLASYLTARRSAASGLASAELSAPIAPRAPAAPTIAGRDPRVMRAFGWAGNAPAISQRVANDTAEVLREIAARFPPQPVQVP